MGYMDDHLRISDDERLTAMSSLASHFTEGRLDTVEFDERTLAASQAKTRGDLRPLFADLPGQLEGALTGTGSTGQAPREPELDAELEQVRARGARVETWDGIIGSVTLAAFLILMFAVNVSWAWVVWPLMGVVVMIPRLINHFSDSDEKTYKELKKAEEEARKVRLQRATKRLKELEEG